MKKAKGLQSAVILILLSLILAEMAITSNVRAQLRIQEEGYMNHNWTITVNDDVTKDVNIDEYKLPIVKRGDVITLDGRMTYKQIKNPTLRLYVEFCECHVYLDGEEIYTSGHDNYEKNSVLGYGRVFVELADDYQGKPLKIVFIVSENSGVTQLEALLLCDGSTARLNMLKDSAMIFFIDIFLIVFGLAIILVSAILLVSNNRIKEVFCIGCFSLCMGLWSICEQNIFTLFFDVFAIKTYLEYISLYFAPMFVFAYFGARVKERMNRRWRTSYTSITLVYAFIFVVGMILCLFKLVPFSQLLLAIIVFTILSGAFILVFCFRELRDGTGEYVAFVTGMWVMAFFTLFDICRFTLINYFTFSTILFNGTCSFGAFVLVIAMLFDIASTVSEQIRKRGKMELYEQLAYNDFLTGLANRRQCELMLDQVEAEGTPYGIVSMDINGLKETNDKYGHDEGDALLKDFSSVLLEVFGKIGTVGRMGGDEFIIIIRNADMYNIEQMFMLFDEKVKEINKNRPRYQIVAARGVCMRHEGKATIREAVREADHRMYVNKAEIKGNNR